MPTKTKIKTKTAKKSKSKAAPRKPRTIRVVEDTSIEETPVEGASVEEAPPATKPEGDGKLSAIDAAAKVLAEEGIAMNAKALIELMALKGYWKSPGGATPHATLYSAIHREIRLKGNKSRFAKAERGQFAIAK